MDVVRAIIDHNRGREAERLALKFAAMRADAFGFFRGSCHLYHARLPRGGRLASAPLAWCCGDLHLSNFGSYKADNRLVHFDLNDFDEAALAPASRDPVRLVSSIFIAASVQHLARAQARALAAAFVDAYADAVAAGKAYWVERDTAQGLVHALLDRLRNRQRPDFLDGRTLRKGRKRVLRLDNGKALPIDGRQREAVLAFMARFARGQHDPDFFEPLDVARRVAGTGSLGVERYVILVRGKGSPDGNYLFDMKRALPSALAALQRSAQPRWKTQAERVVTLQRRMQAVSAAFLHPVVMGERSFVLRALQPWEDRVDFREAAADGRGLQGLVHLLGRVTAWAQVRSAARQGAAGPDELVDWARRRKWRARLLEVGEAAAAQAIADAAAFGAAYDDGAFGRPAAAPKPAQLRVSARA